VVVVMGGAGEYLSSGNHGGLESESHVVLENRGVLCAWESVCSFCLERCGALRVCPHVWSDGPLENHSVHLENEGAVIEKYVLLFGGPHGHHVSASLAILDSSSLALLHEA
jgi:hypothetical protein